MDVNFIMIEVGFHSILFTFSYYSQGPKIIPGGNFPGVIFRSLLNPSVWPFSRTCYTYFDVVKKLNEYCKQHDYVSLFNPLYEQDNIKFYGCF